MDNPTHDAADLVVEVQHIKVPAVTTSETDRNSTASLISIALSTSDASAAHASRSSSEQAAAAVISNDESPAVKFRPEPIILAEHTFAVTALPSPKKDRTSKSRHVRGKSSLQEPDMAALLARLELENIAIAKDPKAGIAQVVAHSGPGAAFEYRVRDTVCSSLSMVTIPEDALGMSLGNFWALVTKDYVEAVRLLPTMTPLMLHKGVPDFLRSAVWVGMAGARDDSLAAEFDSLVQRLQYEQPSNEHIINKDLARCFPQHEMFRDANGLGQSMLGTVLKCYSLYDTEIGYCQGMSFVAGVLLMNMPEKEAFCVFVRLMDCHDLRSLYLPSLSGLHCRTFQLQKLLAQISPQLLAHLSAMNFELAYVAQYFMTIFATNCPLNILFRIYDVVFAEGATETSMRVCLALILSNEHKLLAMKELEDILQLLLGRRLWEPYVSEPDFFMDEIARLSNVVNTEELDKLSLQFSQQTAGDSREKTVLSLGFGSSFMTSGFVVGGYKLFGHLRNPSTSKPPPRSPSASNLLELRGDAPRRSVSKRSVTTIDSSAGSVSGSGSASLMSAESRASTVTTEYDHDKMVKTTRVKEDRTLHEQVEGLLVALSEVQREAAETAAQLQVEHRRKESMAEIVLRLKDMIVQKETVKEDIKRDRRKTMPSRVAVDHAKDVLKSLHRKSAVINDIARSASMNNLASTEPDLELQDSLTRLCTLLETDSNPSVTPKSDAGTFFDQNNPSPAAPSIREPDVRPSRSKRRDSVRYSIYGGMSQHRGNGSPVARVSNSMNSLWPTAHNTDFLAPISSVQTPDTTTSEAADYWPEVSMFDPSPEIGAGPFPKRGSIIHPRKSSMTAREILAITNAPEPAAAQDEALLLELVNAKTREATAMHERDEIKVQNDRLRKQADEAAMRELEFTNKLVEMERMMHAQQQAFRAMQEAHAKELDRYKLASQMATEAAATRSASRAGLKPLSLVPDVPPVPPKTDRSGSLWPSGSAEPLTPSRLSPAAAESGAAGAWGWFGKKARTPSASGTA